ncbi:hypothetical protein [Xanthocytophaga flava]|uniref:hypothetical protein n=1 Tax=Xanthocytophaga flava TaxID=3048013 RepID=UPI0028D90040|nr:hypothetical protein [Xanthocytophaga flavus]MDJ1470358.1 hypothetical protein [Xanthocytophaga flavus]
MRPRLQLISFFAWLIVFYSQAQDISTTSPTVKTFTSNPGKDGAATNTVNLFTGDVALPLNLISLPGDNGLDVNLSISYSSNVQRQVNTWNLESPTGILGLGWSMDIPKIIADHKMTGAKDDDELFLMEAGTSYRLIRTVSGSDAQGNFNAYQTKVYQLWKIKYYPALERWEIIRENGTRYVYGDKNSTRQTIQWVVKWGNWIGNSAQVIGQSQMAFAWNLSEINNLWNQKITFEYSNIEQFVGSQSGQKHTEASYLKRIVNAEGKKIEFFYSDKATQFYTEPHTEKVEPDAYQELYEKQYLDHIDVLNETGSKFISFVFGYGVLNNGTSTAKMLLTSIVQKNTVGNSLPGMQFSYYTSGAVNGFLQTITYPTKGTVTYTYKTEQNLLTRSNRQKTITAPSGYAEAKTWIGEDYVIVSWRQLNGTNHDAGSRPVKLFVYQWVGEWKEQFLMDAPGVTLEGDDFTKDYSTTNQGLEIAVQKNYFAVETGGKITIYYKDLSNRGNWLNYSGIALNRFIPGDNFLLAHTTVAGRNATLLYTFLGDSWQGGESDPTSGTSTCYYTANGNYYITHNIGDPPMELANPDRVQFAYLSEDKIWNFKTLTDASFSLETQKGASYWYSSNTMALAMLANNSEWVYRWDESYANFYLDKKDKDNNDLIGSVTDTRPVYMINNSMIGIDGRIIRFDGNKWYSASISSTHNSPYGFYFSYGEDYVVRPIEYVPASTNYKGGLKVFDPNNLVWNSDIIMSGADQGRDLAHAGIDSYFSGNGFYYKQSNGTWVKNLTYSNASTPVICLSAYPRLYVLAASYPFRVIELRAMKNGQALAPYTIPNANLVYSYRKFISNGFSSQTIITYPSSFSEPENATSLQLNRFINDDITGLQSDYPVTMITEYDGTQYRYTSFEYDFNSATLDVNGTIAQYNKVNIIPGSNSIAVRPFGYSTHYFYNGLSATELGITQTDLLWSGLPYQIVHFDNNGNQVSIQKTTYTTYKNILRNTNGSKVDVAYYIRPTLTSSIVDGIETITTQRYNDKGQVSQTTVLDYDSKTGNTVSPSKADSYYFYYWEKYDASINNIYSPVIQTIQAVSSGSETIYPEITATTWKSWNGVPAPHKSYIWKRSGTQIVFDFANWSNLNEPSSDWIKVTEVNAINEKGKIIQITQR